MSADATRTPENKLQVSLEVAAYNEQWRRLKEVHGSLFDTADIGSDPKYLENRIRLTFEIAWNCAMNWIESRTLKEIKNDK
jgi:hypothetical protein